MAVNRSHGPSSLLHHLRWRQQATGTARHERIVSELSSNTRQIDVEPESRPMRRSLLMLAAAWPALAWIGITRAQPKPPQGSPWRVGFLYAGSRQSAMETGRYDAFRKGMSEFGYVEGRNFVIESRFSDGESERLPQLAAELVQLKPDVILGTGTPALRALQHATVTIPIIITASADPVGDHFADSLSRPGRNFTGLSSGNADVYPKQIELLMAASPKLSHVAVLWNSANDAHPARLKIVHATGQKLGVKMSDVDGRTREAIEHGITLAARDHTNGLIMLSDTFITQQAAQIAELALKYRIASVYGIRLYAEVGGLMTYGQNITDNYHRAASYVDKIFKGAKPADLPIEQPTTYEFIINRKTAKAIGLTIPSELLLRADKVIE